MTNLPFYENNVISLQDPRTGTLRFAGDYSHFSVNTDFFIRLLKTESDRLNLTQARICFHKNDASFLWKQILAWVRLRRSDSVFSSRIKKSVFTEKWE